MSSFQHTAARRRLVDAFVSVVTQELFQHTAARRRLGFCACCTSAVVIVSTHSRPKAAGSRTAILVADTSFQHTAARRRLGQHGSLFPARTNRFNTQPPEGGWFGTVAFVFDEGGVSTHSRPKAAGANYPRQNANAAFQHTAARRRLATDGSTDGSSYNVSTHSRPKAAGNYAREQGWVSKVSTHSRPKAAGSAYDTPRAFNARFNTQPPEGGWACKSEKRGARPLFQHTAARRRLELNHYIGESEKLFQHTAARRRLGLASALRTYRRLFQHTAARRRLVFHCSIFSFCPLFQHTAARRRLGSKRPKSCRRCTFQHTAARRRLGDTSTSSLTLSLFQHTAARRRLGPLQGSP